MADCVNIEILKSTASTNDYLKALAGRKRLPHGYTVMAESQTAGRGRRGKSFLSPAGGLYMSVLLRPAAEPERLALITPVCAVCVTDAIRKFFPGLRPDIKWVNDIMLDGRKVCGILTEAVCGEDGKIDCVICGIGMNIYRPDGGFPPELEDIAGWLSDGYREGLTAEIAGYISSSLSLCSSDADRINEAVGLYRGRVLTGMRVCTSQGTEGIAEAVDEDCRMLVRCDHGGIIKVGEGELTVIRPEKQC